MENLTCKKCGFKGTGYDGKIDPKTGFCAECLEFEAKIRATANVKNTKPRMKWLEENRKS
jgi:hypothetical protein